MFNGINYINYEEMLVSGIEPAKASYPQKHKEVKRDIIVTVPKVELTEAEHNKRQDAYLKLYGI